METAERMVGSVKSGWLMAEFKDWLKNKYGWSYDYFCRICGECRQEEIWNEFYAETKKAP